MNTLRRTTYRLLPIGLAGILSAMPGCASLNYYGGSSNDKEQIRQVLLVHAQSVIAGHAPGHIATHTPNAMSAGPFPGDRQDQPRPMTVPEMEKSAQHPEGGMPPEREVVGRIRLTRMNIKFLRDTVVFATFREVGFDSMDRKVFEHDVAAFLSKEGREWKIYAMAAGDIRFDREGLDEYWYLENPERPRVVQ